MNTPTPVPAPQAPQTTEVRHDFSEVQLETIKPLLDQIGQIQGTLNFFLNHVEREAKLPKSVSGYQLAFDQMAGKPYLKGQVPAKEDK